MAEREMTFTLPEELVKVLEQELEGDPEAFVRRAVLEKLASESVDKKERGATPLLEEFTQELEGKDIDRLIRQARTESESRLVGQGMAYLALYISEVLMEAITTPAAGAGRTSFPLSFLRHEATTTS